MKVIMYFVRHGQTRVNEKGRMQGVCDSPLTSQGELQVEKTRVALNNVFFDAVYSSPSGRCQQTSRIILEGRNLEPVIINNLHEMNFGTFEGTRFTSHSEEITRCFDTNDFSSVNGENPAEVEDRILQSLDTILSNAHDNDQVLVVTHGSYLMTMLRSVFNVDMDKLFPRALGKGNPIPNASIMRVEYEDGKYIVTNLPTEPQLYEDPIVNKTLHFYFVNHGQTLFNQYNRMQGVTDSPITERGMKEILDCADALKEIPFASMYTSPLLRCYETALKIAHDRNSDPVVLDGLKEIDYGEFEAVVRDSWLKELKEHRAKHDDWSDVNGESKDAFELRFHHTLQKIISANKDGSNILLVSHSEYYKRLLEILFGLDGEEAMMEMRRQGKQPHPYGGIFRFDYVNGKFEIVSYMCTPEEFKEEQ